MKTNYLIIAFSLLFFSGYSQRLNQVAFSQGSGFLWFSLLTNQSVLIRISDDGKILESGMEERSRYNKDYFTEKLQPFLGKIDYYGKESDSAFTGKIKNIGTCFFTYYPSNDYPERIGKIKSAGNLFFDYYRKYEDVLIGGKIKNIGSNTIAYFTSFDDEVLKGKLKLVGQTPITYYSSFDDVSIKGKLKSIGAYRYTWYTSYDRKEFNGALKSGSRRQIVNGITYILQ